jgi:DNA-binding MarR family transcriptional regulator
MDEDVIEVALLLRRAQLRKQMACETELARWSMTLPQWGMLRSVAANPDSSTHALALLTGQSDQAAGAVVARLEQRGLLERRSGPGKAIRHRITGEGRNVLRTCDEAVAGVMRATLREFGTRELKELRGFLERLADT